MRSILKLTRANIKHGRGAFKGIIFLMMLLTFSFSGTVSNDDRLEEARQAKYDRVQAADLTVTIYDELLTDEMISSVKNNSHVKDVKIKERVSFVSAPRFDGKELELALTLGGWEDTVQVFTDDAEDFVQDFTLKDGEILLPYKLKLVDGVSDGATLEFRTKNGYDETFKVAGFYEDVMFGATTMSENCCVITQHDLDRLKSEKTDSIMGADRYAFHLDQLWIYSTGDISQLELRRELGKESDLISSSLSAPTKQMFIDNISMYSNVGTRVVAIFTVFLLVVVLITMHNSISSSIEMDKGELGILRSQGFTARMISLVYVFQYTLAIAIGSVLGIAVSVPACRYLISMWKNITGMKAETGVSFLKCGALSVGILVVCTVFIFISTAKISRISPVSAITGAASGNDSKVQSSSRIRPHPLQLSLAVRQLSSRKKSYISITLIVTLLVFFIVSIMILSKGLDPDSLFSEIGGDINITDLGGFRQSDVEDIEQEIRKIDSEAFIETESYHRMLVDGEFVAVHAYRSQEPAFDPLDGSLPQSDDEIMITEAVSEQCGKKIGDTITVKYLGNEKEFKISGYFQTIWEFGVVTMMTPQAIADMGKNDLDAAYVKLSDSSKEQQVIDMLNDKYSERLHAESYKENSTVKTYKKIITVIMSSLSYTMDTILLIFAAVVVSMTSKRAFIRERKDIGIYKATGFTVGALRLQFALRFALVALIGSAIGCISGLLWSRKILTYVLRIVGLTDFTSDNEPVTFIIPAVLICVCFFAAAYISSRRIKSVNVRELITE